MKVALPCIALLACLLVGCERGAADWQEVQREGSDHALYLNVGSIDRHGSLVTFWTRLSSTNWLQRVTHGEMRTEMQIDCQRREWRHLAGGFYVRGEQRFPFKKLLAGGIPNSGYIRSLYNLVC